MRAKLLFLLIFLLGLNKVCSQVLDDYKVEYTQIDTAVTFELTVKDFSDSISYRLLKIIDLQTNQFIEETSSQDRFTLVYNLKDTSPQVGEGFYRIEAIKNGFPIAETNLIKVYFVDIRKPNVIWMGDRMFDNKIIKQFKLNNQ